MDGFPTDQITRLGMVPIQTMPQATAGLWLRDLEVLTYEVHLCWHEGRTLPWGKDLKDWQKDLSSLKV